MSFLFSHCVVKPCCVAGRFVQLAMLCDGRVVWWPCCVVQILHILMLEGS